MVWADRPLRLGKPIVPPAWAELRRQLGTAPSQLARVASNHSRSIITHNRTYSPIAPTQKRKTWTLTGDSVSIHVVEDVPKTEDPGGSSRRAASEQRGAEFLPRLARVEVRVGFESGAHAAGQRVHLIRSAAAFQLTSIALHAHFLARKLQRRGYSEGERDWERRG